MTPSSKRQKREEYRKTHKASANTELPKKKFYRQRAHANPFSDHQLTYPASPAQMDWSSYYPSLVDPNAKNNSEGQSKPLTKPVTIADIGCGFGGLLVALSPLLPEEVILGLEIRTQVTEYVQDRISALRSQHTSSPTLSTQKTPKRPVPIPPLATSDPNNTKEYVIHPKDGDKEPQLAATEACINRITNVDNIMPYRDVENALLQWSLHLTEAQLEELQRLDGIEEIRENVQAWKPCRHLEIASIPPSTRLELITGVEIVDSSNMALVPGSYQNISVLRANTMKFLPNFFTRGQLSTIFLCFPDPHFKARKHKARIVSSTLCAEYAYVIKPGGCVYTITDVEELGEWMRERFETFGKCEGGGGGGGDGGGGGGAGLFERVEIPEEGKEGEWETRDAEQGRVGRLVRCIREETEEGKKVTRNGGTKFVSVWRRREDPAWPDED